MRYRVTVLLLLATLTFQSASVFAEPAAKKIRAGVAASGANASSPGAGRKLEFGIGAGFQYLPDYRGSDRYRTLALPFPMLRYRGKFLRADEDGVRGEYALSPRVVLNVSGDASLTVDADDNALRNGMPGLRPAFEIGPSLNIRLGRDPARSRWALGFPLRSVSGIDGSGAEFIGMLFNPQLVFRTSGRPGRWQYKLGFGAYFADDRYHSYYYGVADRYANARRPAYDAGGGYGGSVLRIAFRKRVGCWWFGGTLRGDFLEGARFEASPLLERKYSFAFSSALGYFFE